MDNAVCVDKEATVGEAFDFAMRQPLFGNAEHPALPFLHHFSFVAPGQGSFMARLFLCVWSRIGQNRQNRRADSIQGRAFHDRKRDKPVSRQTLC